MPLMQYLGKYTHNIGSPSHQMSHLNLPAIVTFDRFGIALRSETISKRQKF